MNFEQQIKQKEKELEELKEKQALFNNLSDEMKLAEALHDIMCHWNHTDGCGWYYESWNSPGFARKHYLNRAEKILKSTHIPGEEVIHIVQLAKGIK